MNIPTSLLLDGKVYVPEAEFIELQAMLAAANRDRDNALKIARGYHDQWAEADRKLTAAREDQDGWEAGFDTGFEKGLEDAAVVADTYEQPGEPGSALWLACGNMAGHIADAIRALSRLPALSAKWAHDLPEGHVQIPEKQTSPADEPPQTARLPGLRDQPIEW